MDIWYCGKQKPVFAKKWAMRSTRKEKIDRKKKNPRRQTDEGTNTKMYGWYCSFKKRPTNFVQLSNLCGWTVSRTKPQCECVSKRVLRTIYINFISQAVHII